MSIQTKSKWYDFITWYRLAEAIPRTIILGSRFLDRYLIYPKGGCPGLKTKSLQDCWWKARIIPHIDSPGEGEDFSISMIQIMDYGEANKNNAKTPAIITHLINQITKKLKI